MVAILSGLVNAGRSAVGIRSTPEPPHTVVRTIGVVEIRRYEPRIAAETTVDGDELRARTVGFERLAGYIFGGNGSRASIAMTAPVGQSATDGTGQSPGRRSIETTAATGRTAASGETWRVRFFMPSGATLATLPQPDDARVTLVVAPAETVAVLRYRGTPTRRAVRDASARLLRDLARSGLSADGAPHAWFYDPPWTIPAFRRNEAVVRVGSA